MSFISYAQNLEDVMLWRALKHVSNGFYVDIGAAWPDEHSVTKAFYIAGWHGINIDPNPDFHAKLQESRPRDINLKIAISDLPGSVEMSLIDGTGLSTLDPAVAKTHQAAGWGVETQRVDVKNLRQVWEEHIPQGQEVHFLKIDIEGLEDAAIRGNNWTQNRPWIVVVEATLPMSQVESHHTWEAMLLQAGYSFAYADGLNRFYVAEEHNELLPAFKYPPNVFDGYILAAQAYAESRVSQAETHASQAETRASQAETRASQAETRASQAETRASQAETRASQAETRASQAEAHISALLNSTSWRITSPLRQTAVILRRLGIKQTMKETIKSLLRHAALYIGRHPRAKQAVLTFINRFPAIKSRLARIAGTTTFITPAQPDHQPKDLNQLTPHARRIYTDLKATITHNKNGRV